VLKNSLSEKLKSLLPPLPYKKPLKLWMDVTHKKSEPLSIWELPKNNYLKTETYWPKLKKPEEEKPMPSKPPLKFTNSPQEPLMKL